MKLFELSATAIAAAVQSREVTAIEVLDAHIARIIALDPVLHCFTDRTFTRAATEAAAIDRKIAAGETVGP